MCAARTLQSDRNRCAARSCPILLVLAFCVWVSGIVVGSVGMIAYATVPEPYGPTPTEWPTESSLPRADDAHTLIMFVHPHCPCTRASFEEMRRALARARKPIRTVVAITAPPGVGEGWHRAHMWRADAVSVGADVVVDRDGREAAHFGVTTSGHVVVYRPDGTLSFSGGITPSRGHEGDNRGRHAISSILHGDRVDDGRTPVFGCPLLSGGPAPRPFHSCCLETPERQPCEP